MMAAVKHKGSRAELALRRELYARGVRYRLHARDILGCPDIVVRKRGVAVFVDGDFWHGNAHVRRGLDSLEDLFPSNKEFWVPKIRRTMERDREVTAELRAAGWHVVRLWEEDVLEDPVVAADAVECLLRGG
jgi:DNA mismatch endonuclease, patch repair protein